MVKTLTDVCMMARGRKVFTRGHLMNILTFYREWAQRVKPSENLILKKE